MYKFLAFLQHQIIVFVYWPISFRLKIGEQGSWWVQRPIWEISSLYSFSLAVMGKISDFLLKISFSNPYDCAKLSFYYTFCFGHNNSWSRFLSREETDTSYVIIIRSSHDNSFFIFTVLRLSCWTIKQTWVCSLSGLTSSPWKLLLYLF